MAEEFINGYHVFALCLGKGPIEELRFEEYENSVGAGGYTQVLVGRNTGEKSWRVSWPTIAGASAQASVEYRGAMLTPADYLWALYNDCKVEGKPFVVKSPRNGQYYFARFANSNLSYQRALTMLFSTGIELRQCYVDGVSVFDPEKLNGIYGRYVAAQAIPMTFVWPTTAGSGNDLALQGDISQIPDVQNGKSILRLNPDFEGPPPTDFVNKPSTTITIHDVLIVMKVREATFTGFQGVFTGSAAQSLLVGNENTDKFFDFSLGSGFEYRINGVKRPANDQAAPMNRFAVVHIHFDAGIAVDNPQFGKQEAFTDRYAKIDLGEIYLLTAANPMNDLLELTQHLITDWNL